MAAFEKRDGYFNGNYLVYRGNNEKWYKRCLRVNEELVADFPDSIDLKITNKCNHSCPYCFADSNPGGADFNVDETIGILSQLPRVPIEIAIGGGNVLEILEDLYKLVLSCNSYGFRTRITINSRDIELFNSSRSKRELIKICGIIDGVGISLDINDPQLIYFDNSNLYRYALVNDYSHAGSDYNYLSRLNTVFHIIAGLFPIKALKNILKVDNLSRLENILILGYKQYGRAANTELPKSMHEFEEVIKEFITNTRNNYEFPFNIAFDNLAIEQLHIRDFITDDEWDRLYLGKEGSCSMYIDAVNRTYSRSSIDKNVVSWDDIGLLEFFRSLRNETNN